MDNEDRTTTVSEERVEQVIDDALIVEQKMLRKTFVLTARLDNGFEITVSSACVEPDDFDKEIAREICHERLKERVFELLGFQGHPSV